MLSVNRIKPDPSPNRLRAQGGPTGETKGGRENQGGPQGPVGGFNALRALAITRAVELFMQSLLASMTPGWAALIVLHRRLQALVQLASRSK